MTVYLVAPLRAPAVRENPKGLLPQIRKQGADVALLTEAYPRVVRDQLAAAKDYRYVVESGGRDRVRGQYDTPILVRRELTSFGSGQVFGCAAARPPQLAPERWMTYAAQMTDQGVVCAIGFHFHAGIQADDGRFNNTGRAAKARRQAKRLDGLLTFAEAMGWKIVTGGDPNFRDIGSAYWSPYRVMQRHGLRIKTSGIITLAYTPSLKLDVTQVKLPKGISDHVWLKGVRH